MISGRRAVVASKLHAPDTDLVRLVRAERFRWRPMLQSPRSALAGLVVSVDVCARFAATVNVRTQEANNSAGVTAGVGGRLRPVRAERRRPGTGLAAQPEGAQSHSFSSLNACGHLYSFSLLTGAGAQAWASQPSPAVRSSPAAAAPLRGGGLGGGSGRVVRTAAEQRTAQTGAPPLAVLHAASRLAHCQHRSHPLAGSSSGGWGFASSSRRRRLQPTRVAGGVDGRTGWGGDGKLSREGAVRVRLFEVNKRIGRGGAR